MNLLWFFVLLRVLRGELFDGKKAGHQTQRRSRREGSDSVFARERRGAIIERREVRFSAHPQMIASPTLAQDQFGVAYDGPIESTIQASQASGWGMSNGRASLAGLTIPIKSTKACPRQVVREESAFSV